MMNGGCYSSFIIPRSSFLFRLHLYRYMTYPAALTKSAAHWRRPNTAAILGRAKIHHRSRHLQPVNIDRDIELIRFLFGVCDRRPERDFDRPRGALIRSLQHSKSFRDVAPANKIDNQAGFLRRALYVFCHCACFHRLLPSWRGFLDRLVALLRMPLELSRRSELAELVANHVLLHVHGDELFPVMHGDCVAYHFRHNRRSPRPGLVDTLLVGLVQPGDRFDQMIINERPFFYRSCHSLPVSGFWFLVSGFWFRAGAGPKTRNHKPETKNYFFPLRTMNLSVRLLFRVLYPRVGWPHGVTGFRPPEVLPSPPP